MVSCSPTRATGGAAVDVAAAAGGAGGVGARTSARVAAGAGTEVGAGGAATSDCATREIGVGVLIGLPGVSWRPKMAPHTSRPSRARQPTPDLEEERELR